MGEAHELVIDVGSGSIGVAFVEKSPEKTGHGKPVLSHAARIAIGGEETGGDLKARVGTTLKGALDAFHKMKAPKHTRIILAAPWYQSEVHTISSEAKKPVRVSTGTVLRAVKGFREKNTKTLAGEHIESAVTQVYVNGYQTLLSKPVLGTSLRIQLYESAADKSVIDLLRATVRSVFPGTTITFHSFPLVTFVVLRALRDEEALTFIDIGGAATDIVIMHADGMRFLGSFPLGSKTLLRDVGGGIAAPDIASRLSLFARGELSTEEAAALAPSFEKAAAIWNTELGKVFEAAVSETPIPRAAFILADPEELVWFEKVMGQAHETFPARVIPITQNFFQMTVALGEDAFYDAFLSLEALFFHTEKKELIEV